MIAGDRYLAEHVNETDRLELFELPADCEKCCTRCGSRRVRIAWNHKNTNSDFAWCAECESRPAIGFIQKRYTGAPTARKRRPDLHVSSDWVFERDGWRCQICGLSPQDDGVKLEVCHILSRAEGKAQGATVEELDDAGNLFAGCRDCNHERGEVSLPPLLILRLIRARIRRGQPT